MIYSGKFKGVIQLALLGESRIFTTLYSCTLLTLVLCALRPNHQLFRLKLNFPFVFCCSIYVRMSVERNVQINLTFHTIPIFLRHAYRFYTKNKVIVGAIEPQRQLLILCFSIGMGSLTFKAIEWRYISQLNSLQQKRFQFVTANHTVCRPHAAAAASSIPVILLLSYRWYNYQVSSNPKIYVAHRIHFFLVDTRLVLDFWLDSIC